MESRKSSDRTSKGENMNQQNLNFRTTSLSSELKQSDKGVEKHLRDLREAMERQFGYGNIREAIRIFVTMRAQVNGRVNS